MLCYMHHYHCFKVLDLFVFMNPKEEEAAKKKEEEERDRLKADWLNLLFTDQSVAAMSPEAWSFCFRNFFLALKAAFVTGSSANSARGCGP